MERFNDTPHFDTSAGDDLCGIAKQMDDLRDYLIGLKRYTKITEETIRDMSCVEEAVMEVLYTRWEECQVALAEAHEDDLHEIDTSQMGLPFPLHFGAMKSPSDFQAMVMRLRTPTNPSTLLSMGVL